MERVNRTWVVLIEARTEENDYYIHHTFGILKFDLPENFIFPGQPIKNNAPTALWFYLNKIDFISTLGNDRLINAADIKKEILEQIPYITLCGDFEAKIEEYKKRNIFNY